MRRAFSLLQTKSVDEGRREIRGIATTPTADRVGDVVEPLGARFKTPMSLLLYHDSLKPVGTVDFAKPTKDGIPFVASLPDVVEPGVVRERVLEAWHSLKYKLIGAVSIGFKPIEGKTELMKSGGLRFKEWEWLELSLVAIPANPEAVIQSFKSMDANRIRKALNMDQRQSAASGPVRKSTTAGVTADQRNRPVRDINEQVNELSARRAELVDEMKGFGDVTELDAEQSKEYDQVTNEFDELEVKLNRATKMQKALEGARPVSSDRRGPNVRTESRTKKELPKGTGFTRYCMAIAAGRGSTSDAVEYAKRWNHETPEVGRYIKAVAGSTGLDSTEWGGELAYADNLASEFVELLRPATVIGRINGFRRVPFNVRIPVQTGGSTVGWVGEQGVKPVTELAFDEIRLEKNKIAGIVVLSEELVRLSSPDAEATVRRDLIEQIAQYQDGQFLDPAITETATRPASITQGVSAVPASGTDGDSLYEDLNDALAAFDTANLSTSSMVFVMPMAVARGISTLRNALGQFEFTGVSPMGGTLLGYPVIVSNSAPAGQITLINASEIFLAEDPSVRVDASNQATIDMAGGETPAFSLWQRNCIGLRAEQWITWVKRRAAAVALITGAAYGPSSS